MDINILRFAARMVEFEKDAAVAVEPLRRNDACAPRVLRQPRLQIEHLKIKDVSNDVDENRRR